MIITELISQQKNDTRYDVYIDNAYSFSADYDEIVEFRIKKGNVLTEDELHDIIYKMQYKKALSKGLSMLSTRVRSRYEIESKLKELNFSSRVIDDVIKRLNELGYINDMEFSKMWIDSNMNIKPVGRRKLASGLKMKGVDPEVIDNALNDSGCNDLDTAIELLKKKIRQSVKTQSSENDVKKLYTKLYRYLLYRGIDYDTAKKAVSICLNSQIDE